MDKAKEQLHQKFGACFGESMSSVFSMLTGRDFAMGTQPPKVLDAGEMGGLVDGTAIIVKANYTKGVNGTLLFALPLREGTMLVDLMLGGEGTPADSLEGDSRDALAETFNQVMGSANQTLTDQAGETMSISNVEIMAVPPGGVNEELTGPGPFLDVPLDATQDAIKATIHILIPDLLEQQLKRKLGLGEAAPPPPAPEPAAAPQPAAAPRAAQVAAGPTAAPLPADAGNLDLLMDIELPLVVRMGQTDMMLGELLKLVPGSILELNRAADAPVELLVNGKRIAMGEVVVVDGNFAFRITEIESTAMRIRSLG
jgi:flagellar motor switch protein FliN/FliY